MKSDFKHVEWKVKVLGKSATLTDFIVDGFKP